MPALTYRKTSEGVYRISTEGVEIGSVALRHRHTKGNREYWHWGVDTMPLMDHGGRPPQGEIDVEGDKVEAGLHDALEAFKRGFLAWHALLEPELWRQNVEYIAYCAKRRRE